MRTIETIATVTTEHTVSLIVPPDISPGEHRVVVVLERIPTLDQSARPPLRFSSYPVKPVSNSMTFRREDMYGDDGR